MLSTIRVGAPRLEDRREWVRVRFAVDGLGPPELWFDVDAVHGDFVAETCDAAAAALLAAAMAAGKPLELEGAMSGKLHWNVHNAVIPVVMRQLPFLTPIRVVPHSLTAGDQPRGAAVLTALSCGVDSFSALEDHLFDESVPRHDRVTHLLFCHVGHHGYGDEVDSRAELRWNDILRAASTLGLPIVRVYSNTSEFYPQEYDSPLNWAATLTLRNSSVPLLLQAGVRRFLFASSNDWSTTRVRETRDMTEADPILLPALSTELTELHPVGLQHSRVEKTRRIAGRALVRSHLDVCIMDGGSNCSACSKCLRTIFTLELLGQLEHFEGRFDLETYRRHRRSYVVRVRAEREEPFKLEIRELMDEVEYRPSLAIRIGTWAVLIWRLLPNGLRQRLRSVPARLR